MLLGDAGSQIGSKGEGMEHDHITTDRAWKLIRDGFQLEQDEAEHVRHCDGCNSFLATLLQLGQDTAKTA